VLLRNHAISGAWVLQANAGLNFYIGNSPMANGAPNVQAGRPWAKLVNMARARGLTGPAEQDAFYRGEALRWWREAPGAALGLFAKKIYLVWSAHETRPNLDLHYFRALSPALSLPWPGFGTLAPLALLGAGLALIRPRRETFLLVIYAAVYTLATAAFVVSSRYRLPLVSAAIPLAGIAAADLAARLRDRAWRGALVRAAALAALAIAVRPVPADVRVRDHAEERYNEGTVLLGLGRNREAEAVFRAAWAERQDDGRIANNLGALLVRTGRAGEAVGWLRGAVRLYPEVPDAWSNLGAALALTGNLEEAKRAYRESLKIDPDRAGARLALGSILLHQGDRAGARRELEAARALGAELPPAEREALGAGEAPPGAPVP
jgi:Flp pilus assembly protein TadD